MEARLNGPTDIAGFRTEAQHLLAQRVPPDQVTWCPGEDANGPWQEDDGVLPAMHRPSSSIVPASFVRLCEYLVQHRDPDRFHLMYRLLWRLVHEPHLRHDHADDDMTRAQHMAQAVRRDLHKLKTQVRFRPVEDPAAPGSPLHVAWCEPAHHVTDQAALSLARRHAAYRWVLFTPARSAYWDGRQLVLGGGSATALNRHSSDGEWLARWRALFSQGR